MIKERVKISIKKIITKKNLIIIIIEKIVKIVIKK